MEDHLNTTINANIEYYNKNADIFFAGSVNADMSDDRKKFLVYVPAGGRILDAGCGSGRDSKAFLDAGYNVVAFDASEEMRKRASKFIGKEVLDLRFEDISFDKEFDGIWASASLLHVSMNELPEVISKMNRALKENGAIYASFKYGEGTTPRGERLFSDFSEKSIVPLFENAGFEIISVEVGPDSRPGREAEKWVSVIGRLSEQK